MHIYKAHCCGKILKRTSKKGYVFYACERGVDCGFITWDVPTKDFCPSCGKTLFKKSGRGAQKPFCINEECPNFLPEDKRGYKKKPVEKEEKEDGEKAEETADKKAAPAKKTAAKKTTTTKKTAATKKTTAKKSTTKKTAAKKTTAAKKSTTDKKEDKE